MAASADVLHYTGVPHHSRTFLWRRGLNWLPLGLSYALLYMGRYNLTVAQSALGDKLMPLSDFGNIFAVGAWVYGLSFLLTGPLTDRVGGRRMMLIGVAGALLANLAMGLVLQGQTLWNWDVSVINIFTVLYAVNMHFQSYGAIAIVTTKAPWFHVRERGKFSSIFGLMISAGIYFAFDWGHAIIKATRAIAGTDLGFWAGLFQKLAGTGGRGVDENWWLFYTPALLLGVGWTAMLLLLRNTPGEAGFSDFDTGESSLKVDGGRVAFSRVFQTILSHPVLLVVCGIEFCSGILRNGVMQWYYLFAGNVGFKKTFFITENWGLMLFLCGASGAWLTGHLSDWFFQSRRGPMAAILYGLMVVCVIGMITTLGHTSHWPMGLAALGVSLAVIGVHGILSGTATADFGGSKNAGAAVGIVDGLVYLGTGLQSVVIGHLVPIGEAAKVASNWSNWPWVLLPAAVVGTILSLRIWHAKPRTATGH